MKPSVIKFGLLIGLLSACQNIPVEALRSNPPSVKKVVKDKSLIDKFINLESNFLNGRDDIVFDNTHVYKLTNNGILALFTKLSRIK